MGAINNKPEPLKTVLVITLGFLVAFLLTRREWALGVSLLIGVMGLISPYLARKIDFLWMKLTWLLSLVVPNILLSAVFFLFLTPIALLSRLFGKKDPLSLKNNRESLFKEYEKSYDKSTFEKPW